MRELGEPLVEEKIEGAAVRIRPARWVTLLLGLVAVALVPWTLYLTFTLPSRHVTFHYDLAWVGFDVALACAFAATTVAALRRSHWLVPLAAVTGTMLVCDAWFDVVTSRSGGEMWEAVAEAVFVELPLAALCGFIVYDAETFLAATVNRFRPRANVQTSTGQAGGRLSATQRSDAKCPSAPATASGAQAGRRGARARRARRG